MWLGKYMSEKLSETKAGFSMLRWWVNWSKPQTQTSGGGMNPPPSHMPQASSVLVPPPNSPAMKTQTQMSKSVSLDILDLSRVIDIYAESQAVQAFDAEMGKERKWTFQKVKGFFARSLQRMGRDAWIGTKKREMVERIKAGLRSGEYTEDFLRSHVMEGTEAIRTESHLWHEQTWEEETLLPVIQTAVDAWITTSPWAERQQKLREVKGAIEGTYPTVTVDTSQLESSLVRLQEAKLGSELQNIDAKLRIFDIGGIEQGNGQRKEWFLVKTADKIANSINNNSKIPQWVKEKLIGAVRHPNTAAVLSAIGTRIVLGWTAFVGSTFTGGLLLPVAVGSVGGGLFAIVRARREMRDRTAEIDRRWARGEMTGTQSYDGESSNISHKTNDWQHPVINLYTRVYQAKNSTEKDDALTAGIYYLAKHRVGREMGMNMLQYDGGESVSRQHVAMIRLMNEVFPELVARWNNGSLLGEWDTSKEATMAKNQYREVRALADAVNGIRQTKEAHYARIEWLKFTGVALGVGTSVWLAVHGLMSLGSGQTIIPSGTILPPAGSPLLTPQYPGWLQAHQFVIRHHWYDNGTPAPRFDHTELMIHTDKTGGWNVSHMLSKTASTLHHGNTTISAAEYTSGKIQAVITPKTGGPSFVLPIDAKGNIQIPASMQNAFNTRSFAFLEVGRVTINTAGDILLNPIATVTGKGDMVFNPVIPPKVLPSPPVVAPVPKDVPWWGIPFWANKYHELGKSEKIQPEWREGESGTPTPLWPNWETSNPPIHLEAQWVIPPMGENKEESEKDSDPTGLWDDTPETQTPLRNEKKELDDLWKEIVNIRQTLEWRKSGENALSETGVANLQDTEKKLLGLYHDRKRKWSAESEKLRSTKLPETEKDTYTKRISSLVESWMLASRNGKPIFMNWQGRTLVAIRTKHGWIIPFYRSMHGTDGKEASKWYPCFGMTDDDAWLIKGTMAWLTKAHGVQELKDVQNTLNREFDWNPEFDTNFGWNSQRNPLVVAWGIEGDFTKEEEKKQTSPKPTDHTEYEPVKAWILEWIMRSTGLPRTQVSYSSTPLPGPSDGIDTARPIIGVPVATPEGEDDSLAGLDREIAAVIKLDDDYSAAMRWLGHFTPIEDSGDTVILKEWVRENDPKEFILRDGHHTGKMTSLMNAIGGQWIINAREALIAFYAKNGKLWLSDKTDIGIASVIWRPKVHTANIGISVREQNNDFANMSRRLYEIGGVSSIPDSATIQLFHELGHQITMNYQLETNDQDMIALIRESNELRWSQDAGITPLSSLPFYRQRAEWSNTNEQFWEDMAELMGLYLMGREHVERYLDDRITTARSMKANISVECKGRIMNILDTAYSAYIA